MVMRIPADSYLEATETAGLCPGYANHLRLLAQLRRRLTEDVREEVSGDSG